MRSLGVPPVATGGAGAIVVGLLVLLLVEREVIRATLLGIVRNGD
jgi:hypothetical protein